MRKKRWWPILATVGLCALGLAATGVGAILWQIDQSVEDLTATARQTFPDASDDVTALMAYIESPDYTFKEKNRFVWALGRLKDPRALPLLQSAYTGKPCDHDTGLCQSELEKAIRLCGGKVTPPASDQ